MVETRQFPKKTKLGGLNPDLSIGIHLSCPLRQQSRKVPLLLEC